MHAACLVAEYESHATAKVGIEVLRLNDFHADAISVAWKGHEAALEKLDRHEDDHDMFEVEKAMGAGAAIAAIAGIPLGICSIMGPIMVAGPLAAIAGGAAVGGALAEASHGKEGHTSSDRVDSRGLYAMANHFGINDHDAAQYEDRIRNGAFLVIVTSTPPRLGEAQAVLKTTGPASLQRFAINHNAT